EGYIHTPLVGRSSLVFLLQHRNGKRYQKTKISTRKYVYISLIETTNLYITEIIFTKIKA
ncbi:hypothetical protein, partial [Vibrio parahaemolyticus]|uniref:hypothetical protein n=1 Tax=Vibrio parahaemolyticus TaxID=670 RepID=UPI001C60C580